MPRILIATLLAMLLSFAAQADNHGAATMERPGVSEAALVTMEAKVTAVDQETREVTLQDAEGNVATITASDRVQNLDQVEVGDLLEVQYYEEVVIQVFGPDEAEPDAAATTAVGKAEPGEKPAAGVIESVAVIATIEAIDKEAGTATLKGPEGNTRTVHPRDPANLDKVAVGDRVLISLTRAFAVQVTEKPQE